MGPYSPKRVPKALVEEMLKIAEELYPDWSKKDQREAARELAKAKMAKKFMLEPQAMVNAGGDKAKDDKVAKQRSEKEWPNPIKLVSCSRSESVSLLRCMSSPLPVTPLGTGNVEALVRRPW